MKKKTTELFIVSARAVHGDLYDYSQTIYKGANSLLRIICKTHGEFFQRPVAHSRGQGCPKCAVEHRKGSMDDVSALRRQEKIIQTCLDRYGVKHPSQTPTVREKISNARSSRKQTKPVDNRTQKQKRIQTCQERYGVDHTSQMDAIQAKRKTTNLMKYGVEHTSHLESTLAKTKKTNIGRYGNEWSVSSPSVMQKIISTNTARYGVPRVLQCPKMRQRCVDALFAKYGGWYVHTSEFTDKRATTCNTRYGVLHESQYHLIDNGVLQLLQDPDWLYAQYVELNKTATHIAAELNINNTTVCNYLRRHEIGIRQIHSTSYKCLAWLTSLNNPDMQHAMNGGEFSIPGTRYRVDGYDRSTNTVYEFHGDVWHGNPTVYAFDECCHPYSDLSAGELYSNTVDRENAIKNLGYNVVVMWEHDWDRVVKSTST